MSKPSPVNPTAAQVRAFYAANPARAERLSEKAQHTLTSNGQMAHEVINDYNKGRKPERQYVVGGTKAAKARNEAAREALRSQGITVGARGPLSKAAQVALKG